MDLYPDRLLTAFCNPDLFNGVGVSVGFTIAIVIMAGLREKIEYNDIPGPFKGSAIVLVTAGLMAMAFLGFSGVI